jgi:hypothetical protein
MALHKVARSKNAIPAVPSIAPTAAPKYFSVEEWDGDKEGEQIIIYAGSGFGKTTLASMAPNPVFIGLDNGGRKIKNPKTGEKLRFIPGLQSFGDIRSALQQTDLFDDYETIVIDTITIMEEWAIPYVLETCPNDKGVTMKNIIQYGYNKGYRHLYDVMKLILADCDFLVKSGKNIILIAQEAANRVPNPAGDDFLQAGPRLTNNKEANIESLYCEWADHILRIAYNSQVVKDKKVTASDERVIFTKGEAHFRAKSRTLPPDISCVTFSEPKDDSIWKFIFQK